MTPEQTEFLKGMIRYSSYDKFEREAMVAALAEIDSLREKLAQAEEDRNNAVAVIDMWIAAAFRLEKERDEAWRERDELEAARKQAQGVIRAYADGENEARAALKAVNAELERWRHGKQTEGDFVCPDSLELTESRAALEKAKTKEPNPFDGGPRCAATGPQGQTCILYAGHIGPHGHDFGDWWPAAAKKPPPAKDHGVIEFELGRHQHARRDGSPCPYMATDVCNKCGWVDRRTWTLTHVRQAIETAGQLHAGLIVRTGSQKNWRTFVASVLTALEGMK